MKKIIVLFLAVLLLVCFIKLSLAAWGEEEVRKVPRKISREAPMEGERIMPKKAEIDTNADGKVDRIENYGDDGVIASIESDTDGDGKFDEWLYYKNGKLVKAAKDTNGDGKEDTWLTY